MNRLELSGHQLPDAAIFDNEMRLSGDDLCARGNRQLYHVQITSNKECDNLATKADIYNVIERLKPMILAGRQEPLVSSHDNSSLYVTVPFDSAVRIAIRSR